MTFNQLHCTIENKLSELWKHLINLAEHEKFEHFHLVLSTVTLAQIVLQLIKMLLPFQ